MLEIKRVETNTTAVEAMLTYDQVVEALGARVGIEAKLSIGGPGTTVSLEWQQPAEDGTPSGVMVYILTDHNYVAAASPASGGSTDKVVPAAIATSPAPIVPAMPGGLASAIGALSGAPAQSPPSA